MKRLICVLKGHDWWWPLYPEKSMAGGWVAYLCTCRRCPKQCWREVVEQ